MFLLQNFDHGYMPHEKDKSKSVKIIKITFLQIIHASNDYLRKETVLIMSELQLRSSKYEIETIVSSCSGLLYIFRDPQRTDVMNDFAMVD
jgi:hypothetical protein